MAVALLWGLAILLMVIGLIGTLLPVMPGALLVFLGMVAGAWAEHFEKVGWPTLASLAILTILVYVVDFLAGAYGARRLGATSWGVAGAVLGALAGMFFGFAGVVIGPFLGAVGGELLARRGLVEASRAGAGAWIGLVLSVAARLALVFAMLGIFVVAYLF
jgi:uncharacterized protein YqgC (DUF456 family)